MRPIDFQPASPEGQLALDALALERAETGRWGETLRLWTGTRRFVVLGRGGRAAREAHLEACRADAVPLLRRVSGGGTVLQGPGCLNFSIVLSLEQRPELRDLNHSYAAILEPLAAGLRARGIGAALLPLCDLAIDGRKFSGNAQARKKRFLLHHGSLLLDYDPDALERYLQHPPKEPTYRQGRRHTDFLCPLPLDEAACRDWILEAFPADEAPQALDDEDHADLERLVADKFANDAWNFSR